MTKCIVFQQSTSHNLQTYCKYKMQKTKGETAWGAEMQSCREIKMSERRKMREKENELSDAQRNWTSSILLKSSLVQYVLFMSSSAAPYHAGWLGAFLAGWIMTGWADETLTGWTTWLTGWCVVHDRRLVPASRSLVLIKTRASKVVCQPHTTFTPTAL